MTEIKRTIQVEVSPHKLWPYFDIRKWPEFSNTFTKVSINTTIFRVKTIAQIHTKFGDNNFYFEAKMTAIDENKRLAFQRFDGPLPGMSTWELVETKEGCRIENTVVFLHTLATPLKEQATHWIDNFLGEIKTAVS